jgi:hypothetical protein
MSEVDDAVGTLGRVGDLERKTRVRSGWYARYLWTFAAGQLVLVPMALLWHGLTEALVFALTNTLLVTALSVYAARQPVVRRGFGIKHGLMMGSWGVTYALGIALGTTAFVDSQAFAAAAAAACALPLATGAWLEARRSS